MTTPVRLPLSSLSPGLSFRQYTLLEKIGVGGQGEVWSALDLDQNRICAIKFNEVPDSDDAHADDIRAEHQLEQLVKLHHSNILPFNEFGFDENLRFSVSPYIPGGTLAQRIKTSPLSSDDVLRLGREISFALDFLHTQGVIHRDLKSSNILLDLGNHAYLADFGLARVITTSTLAFHTGHGTPPYAPPEQNRLTAITPKSDIFSFGILLYEMFTGQLPWNGKKQLGMEQLHSGQELPDPREINPDLPPLLADTLRRVTSADPELRPHSAGEVIETLCHIFNIPYKTTEYEQARDELAVHNNDVAELLRQGFAQWKSAEGAYNIGLTRFALINLEHKKINTDGFNGFLLSQALTYGYHDDQWWLTVSDPQERLLVSSMLIRKGSETITGRVVKHLIGDMEIRAFSNGVPDETVTSLLETGIKATNPLLRQQIFHGVRELAQAGKEWSDKVLSLGTGQMHRLGEIALEDSDAGDATAELIGHLRVSPAVQVVNDHYEEERRITALLLIQNTAGSLPTHVRGGIRYRLSAEWIIQRLIQQPVSLISVYVMTLLGSALGVGIQVYLTYNLTELFDNARITLSLERGLITGALFGLGIFLTRLFVERFQSSNILLRVLSGTLAGSIAMNIAMLVFHVLFVNTPPRGLLIVGGCTVIALTIALASLTRSYLLKVTISSVSILIVIIGTWWIHINFSTSPVELTPIFKYDYAWSLRQIFFTALGVALPIGIFGNLISLTIRDE